MIMFYSGDDFSKETPIPERVLKNPGVMLSYWWIHNKKCGSRWKEHERRRRCERRKKK